MHWLAHLVRVALLRWGYLTLAGGLLGEDAGLPLPGETILMLASFLAHKTHQLALGLIILVGFCAAVVGDNLGFLLGRWIGPRLLRWLSEKLNLEEDMAAAADQIRRRGGITIFSARFIVGLRTIAGPVAGALGMDWKRFLLANALGAATWVTCIAVIGYEFAHAFGTMLGYFAKASWIVSGGLFLAGYLYWRRRKAEIRARNRVHARSHG
ncbi:MAG TPA: DedA family protein [Terracidiphilus sp.]|jgi:membrane-associated protein